MSFDPNEKANREYDVFKAWVRENAPGRDLDAKLLLCASRAYGIAISRAQIRQLGGPKAAAAWERVTWERVTFEGGYLDIYLRLSKVFDVPEADALSAYHARLAELML